MSGYRVPEYHELTPADEVCQRIGALRNALQARGLDAALLFQPVDVFYYSGTMQDARLLIPARGDALLMVRRDPDRAAAESPLKRVAGLEGFHRLRMAVNGHLGTLPGKLGLELDVLPVGVFRKLESIWPDTEMTDISPVILAQRELKSAYEIEKIRQAGLLAQRVYGRVKELLRPGMTEIELAGLMTAEALAGGHQNTLRARNFDSDMYSWHVVSGRSGTVRSRIDAAFAGYGLSPAFPMGAGHKIILEGEPVLIDFGICLDGYQVDLTRMFSLGKPPERALAAYRALEEIQAAMLNHLQPGVLGSELFRMAVHMAGALGFGDAFLGENGHKVRFAGHGVGLEISEPPILAAGRQDAIKAGMTIALELKMVLPDVGAVGLENTVLVTEHGPVNLTPADESWLSS